MLTDASCAQAYRIITQIVFVGSRVVGRAFNEAYRQASASSQYARAQAKAGGGGSAGTTGRANIAAGMTLDEACKILNVKPPATKAARLAEGGADAEMEEVYARFKRLFDANDPQKGGSFYLQSKVLRARERIEAEVGPARERAEQEAEAKGGWKPKVYKDR
jgi:import inner membrane translocase subunit TIM16